MATRGRAGTRRLDSRPTCGSIGVSIGRVRPVRCTGFRRPQIDAAVCFPQHDRWRADSPQVLGRQAYKGVRMHHVRVLRSVVAVVLLLALTAAAQPSAGATTGGQGFRALTGAEARAFQVPGDVRLVWESTLPGSGITQARYQQVVGNAEVFGGQFTVLRRGGEQVAVIGAYYPGLMPTNHVG